MKQAIVTALTAYVAAAQAFTHENKLFELMYHEDAEIVAEALAAYEKDDNLQALRETLHELDDEGFEQVCAYLLKHAHNEAHDALK